MHPVTDEMISDFMAKRTSWPRWLAYEWNKAKPVAVWVAGMRDPVTYGIHRKRGVLDWIGHNKPCLPVCSGSSAAWSDTVSPRVDQNPFQPQRLLGRAWTFGDGRGAALEAAVTDGLAKLRTATKLRRGWTDVGPEMVGANWSAWILEQAQDKIVEAWDDEGIVRAFIARAGRQRVRESTGAFERGR